MVKKNKRLNDVQYFKPLCVCKKNTKLIGYKTKYGDWYNVHTNTRPIASSTKAVYDWLNILHSECTNWQEMLCKANGSTGEYLNDPEAVSVIQAYIDCGAPFGSMKFE